MGTSHNQQTQQYARVSVPAYIYVDVAIKPRERASTILRRAAKIIDSAESEIEYLELSSGFPDDAEPVVYPRRNKNGSISIAKASIEDIHDRKPAF